MSTTARRRRHAQYVATLARLIRDCAEAAVQIYDPIAQQPDEVCAVSTETVSLLARTAPHLLDAAVQADRAQWPGEAQREDRDREQSFIQRYAVSEAELAALNSLFEAEDGGGAAQAPADAGRPGEVPELSGEQVAAAAVMTAADAFLEAHDAGSGDVVLSEIAVAHDLTPEEVLDEAAAIAAGAGLITLNAAQHTRDPSAAAEAVLAAMGQFARAIAISSIDPEQGLEA